MFEPRKIDENQRLTPKQRVVVIAMNLMLLAELTGSMYYGQQQPETLTAVFLRTFIPSALVTLVATRLLLRRLQPQMPVTEDETPSDNGWK